MEEKRPLRRQPEDHNFWSLIMLAVTAGAFLLVVWVATKALFFFLQESPCGPGIPLEIACFTEERGLPARKHDLFSVL